MDVNGGYNNRFDGGLTVGFTVGLTVGLMARLTWQCWAINLSKAFDSSDKRLNKLVRLTQIG